MSSFTFRYIYWTDHGVVPTIQRALLDGLDVLNLFPSGLSKPGPLTIDPYNDMLFWVDTEERRIESSNLLGGNRRILVDKNIENILGIAVFNERLYWVDEKRQLIGRTLSDQCGLEDIVKEGVGSLTDILAVTEVNEIVMKSHPCSADNGKCSHLCLTVKDSSDRAKCSCPDGMVLGTDDKTCIDKISCSSNQFQCHDQKTCIPKPWQCDGISDCYDKSDEESCSACGDGYFECEDKSCISEEKVCDGERDCLHSEDEIGCCKNGLMLLNDPLKAQEIHRVVVQSVRWMPTENKRVKKVVIVGTVTED